MDARTLKRLLDDRKFLLEKIEYYKSKKVLLPGGSRSEVLGHLEKARHNLDFIAHIPHGFLDWAASYYASYHAALALILKKGFSSKNHDATLCALIEGYYNKGLSADDIERLNLIDAQELLSYAESKNKRETASYSSSWVFDRSETKSIIFSSQLFVNKAERIVKEA